MAGLLAPLLDALHSRISVLLRRYDTVEKDKNNNDDDDNDENVAFNEKYKERLVLASALATTLIAVYR